MCSSFVVYPSFPPVCIVGVVSLGITPVASGFMAQITASCGEVGTTVLVMMVMDSLSEMVSPKSHFLFSHKKVLALYRVNLQEMNQGC